VKPPFIPNIKAAAAGGLLHEPAKHNRFHAGRKVTILNFLDLSIGVNY